MKTSFVNKLCAAILLAGALTAAFPSPANAKFIVRTFDCRAPFGWTGWRRLTGPHYRVSLDAMQVSDEFGPSITGTAVAWNAKDQRQTRLRCRAEGRGDVLYCYGADLEFRYVRGETRLLKSGEMLHCR
jgi:hypothetical protein